MSAAFLPFWPNFEGKWGCCGRGGAKTNYDIKTANRGLCPNYIFRRFRTPRPENLPLISYFPNVRPDSRAPRGALLLRRNRQNRLPPAPALRKPYASGQNALPANSMIYISRRPSNINEARRALSRLDALRCALSSQRLGDRETASRKLRNTQRNLRLIEEILANLRLAMLLTPLLRY